MNVRDVYEASRPVIEQFGTDPVKGLTDERVVRNRQHYGGNRLTPPAKDPLWKQYLEKFTDPTIIILCVCAVLAIGIGLYRKEIPWDGIAILVAICIATAGGTWSEYKANKAFELLKKDSDNIPVKVTRNGEFHTITSGDLVAGDLIHLEGGDRIPADGVLLQSIDLMIDESLMTGESVPVNRSAASPRVTGGTFAVVGNGVAVVTAVGDKTELGNLASALGDRFVCQDPTHHKVYRDEGQCEVCGQELQKEEEGQTPLQEKLSELAGQISAVGTYAAILIFLALLGSAVFREDFGVLSAAWRTCLLAVIGVEALVVAAYMATRRKMPPKLLLWQAIIVTCGSLLAAAVVCAGSGDWLVPVRRVLDFFMVAVTIVVVAVPEGLPMAVTIVLAASMRKIRQDNNLVRKMLATETIGAMTVICSDKTGTLTKNQMEVQQVFLHGKLLQGEALKGSKASHAFDLLSLACAVNSTAEIEHVDGRVKFVGNPTEGAMLAWLETLGINYTELRGKMPIHSRLCFSTERKMMTSLSGNDQCAQCLTCPMDGVSAELTSVAGRKDGCRITFTKGAPDKVLPLCDTVLFDKDTRPASQSVSEVLAVTEAMASKCVRPLAIAYRVQHRDQVQGASASGNEMEKGLTLLAIVGLSDPVREDVPGAMKACDAAGIEVKMVTGDHTATARAIAAEIGLLKGSDDLVLTGEQFAVMSDEAAAAIAPRLRVLSRSRPLDKERLVKLLQDQGHVVGVTGDGTNDAPALKKADVGIAMGLRGTEVAKEASDIVLTDDDFGSIVRAVHWGRTLYENLQKFLQFQLTVNV
ncbi:MAG: HAD-IC family P-type ATPase, partial [Planctomycetota bacterium]|nr:HAD-IC family P-type ATPase [Planctomycetota bacterium]